MSDWGGPYVAAMLLTADVPEAYLEINTNDEGYLVSIVGIGNEASVPSLGYVVRVRLVLGLYAGNRGESDDLTISVKEPSGRIHTFPTQAFRYKAAGGSSLTHLQIKLGVTANEPGTYWIRAQSRQRMLSRVPLHIKVLPEIPAVFRAINFEPE